MIHVTDEEWMEFTKVEHKMNKSETALISAVVFLGVMHAIIIGASFV